MGKRPRDSGPEPKGREDRSVGSSKLEAGRSKSAAVKRTPNGARSAGRARSDGKAGKPVHHALKGGVPASRTADVGERKPAKSVGRERGDRATLEEQRAASEWLEGFRKQARLSQSGQPTKQRRDRAGRSEPGERGSVGVAQEPSSNAQEPGRSGRGVGAMRARPFREVKTNGRERRRGRDDVGSAAASRAPRARVNSDLSRAPLTKPATPHAVSSKPIESPVHKADLFREPRPKTIDELFPKKPATHVRSPRSPGRGGPSL